MDWSSLLKNLQANNQTANDATTQIVDRARMAVNPQLQGPPLPNEATPEELKYSQAIGQGVMGIAAPARNIIAKSAPWMQNITEGSVKEAMPVAQGLANSAKDTVYTQAAKAAQKFEQLKKLLRK